MNQLKTIFLLGVLSALLIAIGGALTPGNVYFFFLLAVAMTVFQEQGSTLLMRPQQGSLVIRKH